MLAYGRVMNPLNLFLHFPLLSLHSSNPPSLSISLPLPLLGFLPFFISSLKHLASFSSNLPAQILFLNPPFFWCNPLTHPRQAMRFRRAEGRPQAAIFAAAWDRVLSKRRYRCDASRCQGKCLLQTINTSGSSDNYNPLKSEIMVMWDTAKAQACHPLMFSLCAALILHRKTGEKTYYRLLQI